MMRKKITWHSRGTIPRVSMTPSLAAGVVRVAPPLELSPEKPPVDVVNYKSRSLFYL